MSEKEKQEEIRVEDRRRFDNEGNPVETSEKTVHDNPAGEAPKETASATENEPKSDSHRTGRMDFMSFLFSLVHTAIIQLGDVEDPIKKGVSENLEGARHMIETLELLQEKTKGNLDQLEQQYLEGALFDLRMRYMQKANLIKW